MLGRKLAGFAICFVSIQLGYAEDPKKVELHEIEKLKEFKEHFNEDMGKPRLLVLVSPTCPMCVDGAKWIEEKILAKYPDEEIVVYAVWFNMIPTDHKSRWKPELIDDKRVTHFWDEGHELGRWISENVDACHHLGPIDWDSYYLFDKDVEWKEELGPIEACGSAILRMKKPLIESMDEMFGDEP